MYTLHKSLFYVTSNKCGQKHWLHLVAGSYTLRDAELLISGLENHQF